MERRLETQQRRVRELNDQRNTVEDEVFGDLCEQLGVPNIRKYAEKEFVLQQERERRNKEYEQQIMTLKQTREYEATRDTLRPIEELEKALKDLKKAMIYLFVHAYRALHTHSILYYWVSVYCICIHD